MTRIEKYFKEIKEMGLYDFYLIESNGKYKVYIKLYNSDGQYIGDRIWGTYEDIQEVIVLCENTEKNYNYLNAFKSKPEFIQLSFSLDELDESSNSN